MLKHLLKFVSICVLGASFSPLTHAKTIWHWNDQFSDSEKKKLKSWITETIVSVETYAGAYPFDVHIYFHRKDNASEPVPWANTQRSDLQGVHFHVDTRYPTKAFTNDWTAPHELSHLLIPYLGKDLRWFAEGFASYMQYQVMQEMGMLNEQETSEKYENRIRRADKRYSMPNMPFTEAAPVLFERRLYPVMYWGGASYFLNIDKALKENESSLKDVLREYVSCCRMRKSNFHELIQLFDKISETTAFSDQLKKYKLKPGFPEYDSLFH